MKKKIIGLLIFMVTIGIVFSVHYNHKFLTTKTVTYNGNNLRISIDGTVSDTLPTNGNYYLVNYECKSSNTKLSWDRENYTLEVSNQNRKAGVSCYLNFESMPKLSDMASGSYVAYTGNNGCTGESCSGQNANYVDDDDMGYCSSADSYKYIVNGWRIAYSLDNTAYLISAGSPECMCTNASGVASDSSCEDYEVKSGGESNHLKNLNNISLKYCNADYSYNGICDENTSWTMNTTDFYNIIGKKLSSSSCINVRGDKTCGYTIDLIDVGESYWIADYFSSSSTTYLFYQWLASSRITTNNYSYRLYGVRPILRLDDSVVVIGGSGTYEDPYQIGNNTFRVNGGNNYISADAKSSVVLDLISSNAATMCISVDSSGCSNYIDFTDTYTLDLSAEEDGEKIIYVYYQDSLGGLVASLTQKITIDSEAPTGSRLTINDGTGLTRVLTTFAMGADTMCLSNTSSSVADCTDWVPYATSYTWRLSDGTGDKTVYAFYKDKAGNVSSASDTTTVSSIVEFAVTEAFDDTTYDTNITVTGGTTYPWTVTSGQFRSNNSGIVSSTSSSTIQFTPTTNAVLSFDYGVSSEANYDKLTITLIGSDSTSIVIADAISGTVDESVSNIRLLSGVTYTLELSYKKDKSGSYGNDRAYIDNLTITS